MYSVHRRQCIPQMERSRSMSIWVVVLSCLFLDCQRNFFFFFNQRNGQFPLFWSGNNEANPHYKIGSLSYMNSSECLHYCSWCWEKSCLEEMDLNCLMWLCCPLHYLSCLSTSILAACWWCLYGWVCPKSCGPASEFWRREQCAVGASVVCFARLRPQWLTFLSGVRFQRSVGMLQWTLKD